MGLGLGLGLASPNPHPRQASRAALEQQAAALPWHLLGGPLAEGRAAPDLLQMLPRLPGTAQLLFGRLDWFANPNPNPDRTPIPNPP